jgi:hypothetical protein
MKALFLTLFWVHFGLILYGQSNLTFMGAPVGLPNANSNMALVMDNRYQGIKGSPRLFDKWYPAEIILNGGQKYQNIPLKLDVFENQELITKNQAGDSLFVKEDMVSYFSIYNEDTKITHTFKRFKEKSTDKKPIFFDVLHEGKYSLLAKRYKNFSPADFKGGYSTQRFYDEYTNATDLFVKTAETEDLVKMKSNKKAIMKVLAGKDKELSAFIDKENLDLKNEQDLAKLFAYYNQLLN